VLYGGPNEYHELAVEGDQTDSDGLVEGSEVMIKQKAGYTIVNWAVTPERKVVRLQGDLYVYLLSMSSTWDSFLYLLCRSLLDGQLTTSTDRTEAYNFWVPPISGQTGASDVIVKAGYLIRTVEVSPHTLSLVGDVNATTPLEIIGGAPKNLRTVLFNGKPLRFHQARDGGVVTATVPFKDCCVLPVA